ncbi:sel1 repeat family protein [Spiribacter sp. C176]|uniref:Sel1 repeat family protein n=1 Tax=Spiribacter salilacus TaxID=2664894 RepID=A0A6N7QPV2_9GAMM|nr:tetratricopeptide repeat protein [Spiribacter salilacus]MRH77720.1 sel1 repeat family protein [Spiribacter salilacus]
MKRIIRAVVMALLLAPGMLWANDLTQQFKAGVEAYKIRDYETAYEIFLPFAEGGLDIAQYNLGLMYSHGQGVAQDYAEAARWYRLAAEQGDVDAQLNLGVLYVQGQGVAQDYAEAVRWYRLAAEQGNAKAQYNLGRMYGLGNGVIQDYSTAHMWFNIAASNGNSDAVHNRDVIADRMTPEAIADAQSRARICIESDYQDCD